MSGEQERLYLPGGTVAHLCDSNVYDNGIWASNCGISDYRWSWRGTGTQEEYEKAQELRVCRRCIR